MELTSFVSPKWVPQMQDAGEIVDACMTMDSRDIVLAPNKRGIERVYETGCRSVAVFVGVSDSFNQKNINKTTEEAMKGLAPLIAELKEKGYFVRACISTAFHCPYEGKILPEDTLSLCQEFVSLGVDELSVADTVGRANPSEAYHLFSLLKQELPDTLLTAHFHDTRKMALANILASLEAESTALTQVQVDSEAALSPPVQQGMLRLKMSCICLRKWGFPQGLTLRNSPLPSTS